MSGAIEQFQLAITAASSRRYTARKPKGPVLQNTKLEEVAAPTLKRGFVMPGFWGSVRPHPYMVSGGMGLSARTAARLRACFEHPAHPTRFKTRTVDFLDSPEGIQTMTVPFEAGTAAPIPSTDLLHQDALAALATAQFNLRRGNVPAARRQAVRALAALVAAEKKGVRS